MVNAARRRRLRADDWANPAARNQPELTPAPAPSNQPRGQQGWIYSTQRGNRWSALCMFRLESIAFPPANPSHAAAGPAGVRGVARPCRAAGSADPVPTYPKASRAGAEGLPMLHDGRLEGYTTLTNNV